MHELITKLKNAKYCIAFTGAGSSTLSGIRDFRGKNGIYTEFDAERIFSIDYFMHSPSEFYHHAKNFFYSLDEKEPNIVHTECARMEKMDIIKRVITQNIDMLHQKAGSKDVIEVHGSPLIHTCLSCHKEFTFKQVQSMLESVEIPYCDTCNGIIKPNVTFFGEPLPVNAINEAILESRSADLMLVLGSSLVVQPAASLPVYTVQNGGKIVIVNNQPTPLDNLAALRYESLEDVFGFLRNNLALLNNL